MRRVEKHQGEDDETGRGGKAARQDYVELVKGRVAEQGLCRIWGAVSVPGAYRNL